MSATAPDLTDFQTFPIFAKDYEKQGLGTLDTLRWLVRFRTKNGLLRSGAVVEIRTPGCKRPRLLINRPKFAAWLANSGAVQG